LETEEGWVGQGEWKNVLEMGICGREKCEKSKIPIGDQRGKGSIKGEVIHEHHSFWTPKLIVNAVREV
jgi:hypothetical protein